MMPAGPRLNEALGDASGRACHTCSTRAQYLSACSERAGDDFLLYLDPGPWTLELWSRDLSDLSPGVSSFC